MRAVAVQFVRRSLYTGSDAEKDNGWQFAGYINSSHQTEPLSRDDVVVNIDYKVTQSLSPSSFDSRH